MAHIRVIGPKEADGELKETYDRIRKQRGAIANVHAIHSLHPKTMQTHIDFYVSVLYGKSKLTRRERELIAVAVSHANGCDYCVQHHADAFARYEKNEAIVAGLRAKGDHGDLSSRDRALVFFAQGVTKRPDVTPQDDVERLRRVGLDDEQILMATLTAAYFKFVNRVVLTLDVDMEQVEAEYNY